MPTRIFAAVVCLGISASCLASFEMALISDNATKTVHRYDVDNGVYLGSFGSGRFTGTVGSICIDQTLNAAYVADGTIIRKFDYNTGEYLGGMNLGGSAIRQMNLANDGRIIVANGAAGAGANVYTFGNLTPTSMIGFGTATVISTIQSQNGSWQDFMNDGSVYRVFGRSSIGSSPVNYVGGGSATGIDMVGRGNRIAYMFATTWAFWGVASTSASGAVSGLNFPSTAQSITAGYSITGLSWGHVDTYGVATNGTASQMGFYDTVGNVVTVRNLPTQIQNARDLAVVVAPEPTSMLALGCGLGLLLRRRRRR